MYTIYKYCFDSFIYLRKIIFDSEDHEIKFHKMNMVFAIWSVVLKHQNQFVFYCHKIYIIFNNMNTT